MSIPDRFECGPQDVCLSRNRWRTTSPRLAVLFGDLLPDGSIDDTANSNNGDIVKVLATVMDILRAFCSQHPAMLIYFEGSTELRTMLYARILKTYYTDIAEEFAIDGIIEDGEGTQVITYDPQINQKYFGFFVKRKA